MGQLPPALVSPGVHGSLGSETHSARATVQQREHEPCVTTHIPGTPHNGRLMRASLAPGQLEAFAAEGLIGLLPAGGE